MRVILLTSLSVFAACGGGGSPSGPGDGGSLDLAKGDGAAPSGWVFGGACGSATFGGITPTINIAATAPIAASVSFTFSQEAGLGTITVCDALNHAMQKAAPDVTPDTLPADKANPSQINPLLYFSFSTPGPNSILLIAASLTITPTPGSAFATFIGASSQCEFDMLDVPTMTWKPQGISSQFMPQMTSYTIPEIVLRPATIGIPVGQTIFGVSCN